MTADRYLRQILDSYAVNAQSVEAEVNKLYPIVKRWGGIQLLECEYSGSIAKGTANSISTDADVLLSLSSTTGGTLKQIYDSLAASFMSAGYMPIMQTVSIGIRSGGFKTDWVPGRRQSQFGYDHSLYVRKTDSWTKTNVRSHVKTVADSNRIEEIRLTKVWRDLHSIEFPSFYLELVVIETLRYAPLHDVPTNFFRVLQFLASTEFLTNRYVDPSNSNNVLSEELTIFEKQQIQRQAAESVGKSEWGQIVW